MLFYENQITQLLTNPKTKFQPFKLKLQVSRIFLIINNNSNDLCDNNFMNKIILSTTYNCAIKNVNDNIKHDETLNCYKLYFNL